jgi:hypothetical protein
VVPRQEFRAGEWYRGTTTDRGAEIAFTLCRHIEEATGPTGAKLPASVLSAAIRRGELPEGAQPFPYEEITGSVLLLRRLNGLPAGPEYLTHLVDTVLIPAL